MIQDVYLPKSDTLVYFQKLQDRFYMEKKILQLRSFIQRNQNNVLTKPTQSIFEEMLTKDNQEQL